MKRSFTMLLVAAAALTLCTACVHNQPLTKSGLDPLQFEDPNPTEPVALYTLTNANGVEACITNFGARLVSLMVPDKEGQLTDVVLGFDNLNDYRTVPTDFGATIGRYANRIGQGTFTLDGVVYDLPKNNFGHCLHGGPNGWQYKVFKVIEATPQTLTMELTSPHGDEHFPGEVIAQVTYHLTNNNAVEISYKAQTNQPTVINLTNHSYFNLSGNPTQTILDHELYLNANEFTPVDDTFMTTGAIWPVAGTPMDFTTAKTIGRDIEQTSYEQVRFGKGFDHNWILNTQGRADRVAATLYCPATGIQMDVYTTEPGVQVYTGNFLDGTVTGKKGITYQQRTAICLETQHYPDTPNKPQWPTAVLRPGETYQSYCQYHFSIR